MTTGLLAFVDDWWPLWGAVIMVGLAVLLWPMITGLILLSVGTLLCLAAMLIGHVREYADAKR
jgi:hypothetical protein